MRTTTRVGALFVVLAALLLLPGTGLRAQVSDKVLTVRAGLALEGQPFTLSAELVRSSEVQDVIVAYRSGGSTEFRQMEATLNGNTAMVTIRGAEVAPPTLEYYLIMHIRGTDSVQTFTYPAENPEVKPIRVDVQPGNMKDKTIIFLSPEQGGSATLDDLLVSVSLIRVDSTVNRSATKIYLDDHDVTSYAVISEDLVTLSPDNITPRPSGGSHSVRVELYGADGSLYHKASVSYNQIALATSGAEASEFQYNVSAQVEARNENISSNATQYNRGTLNASGKYGALEVNGRLYVTNEDKESVQPQNRYYIEAKTSWLRAGFGDAYPVFPSLMMSGKRIRGLVANLGLGFFNFDFATGEGTRKIEGDTLFTFNHPPGSTLPPDGAYGTYDTTNGKDVWAKFKYGSYSRQITAMRPSFGSGEHFQWGFTYLKAKDDQNSILYGAKPQENIAFGTDMTIGFDHKNILLTAQGGASVYNNDISRGSMTDSQIDSLFPNDPSKAQNLRDLRDKVQQFITVNQYLVPLGIDKISSIMAGEGAISLNYFDNFLKAGYLFRGSQYNSFGANFLRKDVKGINVFDRIRLIQSQLFLSGSVEMLEDNLDGSKAAVTKYNTWNSTVSYFPRFNFPNLTVGYGENNNSNGLSIFDYHDSIVVNGVTVSNPDAYKGKIAIDDKTTRWFFQAGYDFTAKYQHNIQLGLSNASRNDNTYQQANTKNMVVSGTLTTTWNIPLQTALGVSLNSNKIPSANVNGAAVLTDYSYTSLNISGRYRMLDERLRFFAILSPTFGDFQRTMWDASAEYMLYQNVWAVSELSLLQNPGGNSDVIWSLILRYNM